jgi:hypothetical protein
MVKLDDLPTEQERVQLDKIQEFMESLGGKINLIATDEDWQKPASGKTGGLKIHYITEVPFICNFNFDKGIAVDEPITYEEGLPVTQLYGKMASRILRENMEKMGIDDTEDLQDARYWYRLRAMRTGFPRLIPFEKVE